MANTTGLAAEFFVAAELLKLGHLVTITFGNTKSVDIIVCHKDQPDQRRTIDVKGLRRKNYWPLGNRKPEARDSHFYVFCVLGGNQQHPTYYILPSSDVRKLAILAKDDKSYWLYFNHIVKEEHSDWNRLWV